MKFSSSFDVQLLSSTANYGPIGRPSRASNIAKEEPCLFQWDELTMGGGVPLAEHCECLHLLRSFTATWEDYIVSSVQSVSKEETSNDNTVPLPSTQPCENLHQESEMESDLPELSKCTRNEEEVNMQNEEEEEVQNEDYQEVQNEKNEVMQNLTRFMIQNYQQ